jgi:hypothetical protein
MANIIRVGPQPKVTGYTGTGWQYGNTTIPVLQGVSQVSAGGGGAAGGGKVRINPVATPYDKVLAQARASLYGPGQLRTIANQQTQAQINAALGASNASSKLEQQQFADLQNRAMGFASALGNLEAGMAPSVGQAYQNAATALGAYGTGLTGAASADEQAMADKARQQVSSLIGSENAGLVGGYDIPGLRGTSLATGVTLPMASLGEQAATAVRLQNAAATTAYGGVETIAKDYAQQAIDALNQRAAERAQIIAKQPELFQQALEAQRQDRSQTLSQLATLTGNRADYLANLATRKEAKREFGVTEADKLREARTQAAQWAQEFGLKQSQQDITSQYLYNTMRQTGASITGYDPVTGEPTFSTVQGNRQWQQNKAQIANAYSNQNGYKTDWRGNPILDKSGKLQPILGAKLNKAGTGVVKTYAPSSTTSGGLTAGERKSAFTDARSLASKAWTGRQKAIANATSGTTGGTTGGTSGGGLNITGVDLGPGAGTSTGTGKPTTPAGSLLEDYTQTYKAVVESLRGSGVTNEKQIRIQARRAMRAAGWKEPTKLDVAAAKTWPKALADIASIGV